MGGSWPQLIIIPALIVLAAVGVALLFGHLAGASDNIESQLEQLRSAPLYKDRGLAASNIANMIPTIKEPEKRSQLSSELIEILNQKTEPDEDPLQRFLLQAIGRLGQAGGLDAIFKRLDAPRPIIRMGAVLGVMSWPDLEQARAAVPQLIQRLGDQDPDVAAVAAAALEKLGRSGDPGLLPALRAAMTGAGNGFRELTWNAAVTLACLGDPQGSKMVAEVLLDREALAKLPADEAGPGAAQGMPPAMQDQVILSVLEAAPTMTNPSVWDKIKSLAEQDPNRVIQKAARELLLDRQAHTLSPAGAVSPEKSPESP